MKIGYPCLNRTIGCKAARTFRLKSYSEERVIDAVANNLDCLQNILAFNVERDLLFFRITSDLVPFASHRVNQFDWQRYFTSQFRTIGRFIKAQNIRISMHPDQFTLINSIDAEVFERSVRELRYHAAVLDLMGLDRAAKIQLHVGGVYGDKQASMQRFVTRYGELEDTIRRRLVIENDDRLYTLDECLQLHEETGIPVLFDVYHHEVNSSGASLREAVSRITGTWKHRDGLPMVDYSSPAPSSQRRGKHAETIDLRHFQQFIEETAGLEFDLMLEIKDKEASALQAVTVLKQLERI
ncbi:MAG TPA: UV DNA damage repair endonuclease UvsE [Methanomicrobia archaeon]|nr:UV DNA damage repair endonuclease UvsE [Methanomicrobia archaeon]